METLYTLTSEYLHLLEMAEDPDTEPEVLADTLEGIDGEIEVKADGYAKVIRQLTADALTLDMEAKRLTERKRAIENNIVRMKDALQVSMVALGKTKFKTALFSFNVQKNPVSVVIDSDDIPDRYLIPVEPKVDKSAIKKELQGGADLPFAHLEQTQSLRIR